jgi:hypothetical protein
MRHRFTNSQQKPLPPDSPADEAMPEKVSPEIRAERRKLRQDDATGATKEYLEQKRAIDENMERLRALRLAREAQAKKPKSNR